MNNKGFAITTVIYGLSILGLLLIVIIMGSLSTNRANIKELSRDIDNELNFYSRSSISYSFTEPNDLQQFEVPVGQTGLYRIELWGAQGNGESGGKGAYTTGVVALQEGDILFFKVGGSSNGQPGGSTDVRIIEDNGKLGLASRIMVAGGGGQVSTALGGTLCGYNSYMNSDGGKVMPLNQYKLSSGNYFGTKDGNASPQSINDCLVGPIKGTTKSSDEEVSRSGDGYYVSNAEDSDPKKDARNYGGSSYISGYAGVVPVTNTLGGRGWSTYRKTNVENLSVDDSGNIFYEDTSSGDSKNEYTFLDGLMLPGVKSGNGAARIEKLSVDAEIAKSYIYYYKYNDNNNFRNKKYFSRVKSIKDCSSSPLKNIEIIHDGIDYKGSFTETSFEENGLSCKQYNYSSSLFIDEIALWHEPWKNIQNEKLTITYYDNSEGVDKNVELNLSDSGAETLDGVRITAFQPDYFNNDLDYDGGNYYIFSILSENKVISAQQSDDSDLNPVKLDPLMGESRQKWSISKIPDKIKDPAYTENNEYSIVELTRYGALTIELDENMAKNRIIAYDKFNSIARNTPQIWRIIRVGNGTYRINTPVTYFDTNTGSLLASPSTANNFSDHSNQLIIATENAATARFKFYKLDY